MKILIQFSGMAEVEIHEHLGTARVTMQPPQFQTQTLLYSGGAGQPNAEETRDYRLIALAHVLKFLNDGAQEELSNIGEPAVTQNVGDA